VINLGSGAETSINTLVDKLARATGRKVSVLRSSAQSGGVSRLCADVRKAQQLLNYAPKTDLDLGLRLTLERDPRFQVVAKGQNALAH